MSTWDSNNDTTNKTFFNSSSTSRRRNGLPVCVQNEIEFSSIFSNRNRQNTTTRMRLAQIGLLSYSIPYDAIVIVKMQCCFLNETR